MKKLFNSNDANQTKKVRYLVICMSTIAVILLGVFIGKKYFFKDQTISLEDDIPTPLSDSENSSSGEILDLENQPVIPKEDDFSTETVFDSLSAMCSANLKPGVEVETLGYLEPGDQGNARYLIRADYSYPLDGIYSFELLNGNYAELIIPDDGIVNVILGDVFPEMEISNAINKMIQSSVGRVRGLQFNSGRYIVDEPIFLESLAYYGNGDTVLFVSENFKSYDDKIILTKPNTDCPSFSVEFYGIDFVYETSSYHSMKAKETILLALQEIDSCTIDNCNFVARPAEINGDYMKVDLLWFKHSRSIKNVTVRNSNFENRTGEGYKGNKSDYLVGGCIWACGKLGDDQDIIDNITIDNCVLSTTVSDEALAIWKATISNVNITGSKFICNYHNSHNLVALYSGTFNNTNVSDNVFEVNSPCMYVIKYNSLKGTSDLAVNNNSFYIHEGNASTNAGAIIYLAQGENDDNSQLDFTNNIVELDSSVSYQAAFRVGNTNNKTINMNGNYLLGTFTAGLIFTENSNNIVLLADQNVIQTNSCIGNVKNSFGNTVSLKDNTIKNKPTLTISKAGTVDYLLVGNAIEKAGTVLNANGLTENNGMSNLTVSNNVGSDGINAAKLYYFNSNSKVDQSELVTIVAE